MSHIVDKVLAGLASSRESMQAQVDKINEILEKSNNVLMAIELSNGKLQSPSTKTDNSLKLYNFNTESELALVKIIDQFQKLMQDSDNNTPCESTTLDSCLLYRQRVECVVSASRKLVALWNVAAQLKQLIEDDQNDDLSSHIENICPEDEEI